MQSVIDMFCSLWVWAQLNCRLAEMLKPEMLKAAICCDSPVSQLYGSQTLLCHLSVKMPIRGEAWQNEPSQKGYLHSSQHI